MPRFYDLDQQALPERWIQMIRDTIAGLAPKVVASRMVREYVTSLYTPASVSSLALDSSSGGAAGTGELEAQNPRRVADGVG